ncbi:ankyrin repeat domain-containing protein 55-like [Watersipora subatra]|uniref:ankyrin repeat domain-containing protein 55-like n=1 Tax=Watersipora subatra TaxID=2589382 RepID=UPI00355B9CE0
MPSQAPPSLEEQPTPDAQTGAMKGAEMNTNMSNGTAVMPTSSYNFDSGTLMHAVVHGKLSTVKELCESGHSINQQDSEGRTPLAIACYQGWYEGTLYLISNGADQMIADNKNRLPLHAATYDSKIRCLALLVQNMTPSELNFPDCECMLALHWAAYHDRPEHVQLLVSKKANMLATDCDGKTALHWASQKGHYSCVEILLREARGTNLVNMKDRSGKGAIHYAAAAGHYKVMECLSKIRSCNIHLLDLQDRQPLHWAAAMGRDACVELLLKLGADPNIHDVDTKNALYYAKRSGYAECVSILTSTMKQLRIAKREELKAVEETAQTHRQIKVQSREEGSCDITGTSQTVSSSSTSISSANVKLPPIRGITGLTQSTEDTNDSPDKPKSNAKPIELRSEGESTNRCKDERPVNKAMKFSPTKRLYSETTEESQH